MTRIGLVGYYRYGNFGDDLMALMFSRAICDAGGVPVVLNQGNALLDRLGLNSVASVEELVAESDCVLLGGGGALQEYGCSDPTSRSNEYSSLLHKVAYSAGRRDVPLFAASIGGETSSVVRPLRSGVVSFLSSPVFGGATVRLRSDVECLRFLGASAEYFPDVVLSAGDVLSGNLVRRDECSETVGFQCGDRRMARAVWRASLRASIPPIKFLLTDESDRHQLEKWLVGLPSPDVYVASDIRETIGVLSGLSAIVGNRLHLGMVGISLGVPFVTANPRAKVRRFFDDLKMDIPEVVLGVSGSRGVWRSLKKALQVSRELSFSEARKLSYGHLEFVRGLVSCKDN